MDFCYFIIVQLCFYGFVYLSTTGGLTVDIQLYAVLRHVYYQVFINASTILYSKMSSIDIVFANPVSKSKTPMSSCTTKTNKFSLNILKSFTIQQLG